MAIPTLQAINHLNLHQLPDQAEDQVNLTQTGRNLSNYFWMFTRFKNYLNECKFLGKKICILDCGAGEGKALDDLLSGKYSKIIDKCTGVSLHYFSNVRKILKKHQGKLEWVLGDAVKVLPEIFSKYDVILDYFGAYFYSPHRTELLAEYHRLLTPDGYSFIFINQGPYALKNRVRLSGTSDIPRYRGLEKLLHKRSPDTFSVESRRVLSIRKRRRHYCGVHTRIISVCEQSSIGNAHPVSRLKKGNAWYPYRVIYEILKAD